MIWLSLPLFSFYIFTHAQRGKARILLSFFLFVFQRCCYFILPVLKDIHKERRRRFFNSSHLTICTVPKKKKSRNSNNAL